MADRFDLEDQIVKCWCVLDDLRMIIDPMEDDHIDRKRIEAVIALYDMKFSSLWNVFSELVETDKFKKTFSDD